MADLKYTDVFNRIWEAYHRGDKLIILQGGQGSSKTFSVLQFLAAVARVIPASVSPLPLMPYRTSSQVLCRTSTRSLPTWV
jgi:hypothetical protein